MSNEYEVISYHRTNYKFSTVRAVYCAPHVHKEIEIGLLLEGKFTVHSSKETAVLSPGDLWIVNPYQSHETMSATPEMPALVAEVQIPPSFFKSYFPQIETIQFPLQARTSDPDKHRWLICQMLEMAQLYFQQDKRFELKCAGRINLFLDHLLEVVSYRLISEKEQAMAANRVARIRSITAYIEENCGRKLLLSEIAAREGLSMSYLSHFFKDHYGMPFQDYLTRVRCEKAQQMLLSSELSLLEIGISCGFSDPKYFNKGFIALYGCSPREYRRHFRPKEQLDRQGPLLTVQTILSPKESLSILKKYATKFQPPSGI